MLKCMLISNIFRDRNGLIAVYSVGHKYIIYFLFFTEKLQQRNNILQSCSKNDEVILQLNSNHPNNNIVGKERRNERFQYISYIYIY